MTIDEAIAHARAVAKHKRKKLDECNKKNNYACKFCIEIRTCKEVAEEHEQLAEWLEELKKYKEKPEGWMWDEAEMKGYNKAIDDFAKKLIMEYEVYDIDDVFASSTIYSYTSACYLFENYIEKIAKQLKAGGESGTDN